MNFSADLIPDIWLWVGNGFYLLLLSWALWRTPWEYLKNRNDMYVLLVSCLLLWMIWRIAGHVAIGPGLEFHLLLMTTITLMFGWSYAILCASLAQLGLTLGGQAEWGTYAWNMLLNGALPVGVTYSIYRLMDWWLPRHFFVYIYVCAFLGGALAMLLSRLAGLGLLLASGASGLEQITPDYLKILPIMLFPEAFLNGGLITMLVVFRPEWVSSFTDERYLRGK